MKNPPEIKALAYERLSEADILCKAGKYDGAFYLAGYSIELMLKAKICERFDIDNLFDETVKDGIINKVRQTVKLHDISLLLIFSGLRKKLDEEKEDNPILFTTNALLFENSGKCIWSEQLRYQANARNPDKVKQLISLLDHNDGLLKWIAK